MKPQDMIWLSGAIKRLDNLYKLGKISKPTYKKVEEYYSNLIEYEHL